MTDNRSQEVRIFTLNVSLLQGCDIKGISSDFRGGNKIVISMLLSLGPGLAPDHQKDKSY